MRKIITVLAVVLALGATAQQRSIDHPMTRAVLDAYAQILKDDPNDYETLLQRAREYYNHNEYILALRDVDSALGLTPADKRDMRYEEYLLRANIYLQTGRDQQALADLASASAIDPNQAAVVYLKANTEFKLEDYAAAKADYQRLLRLNPRSAEALIGLARVAVKETNIGVANDYLEQAVSLDPNNAEGYLRRATVRQMMGNDNGAVDDLVLALSINSTNPKAVDALLKYADSNYQAVITGLSSAIAQAPKNALFWYLRAQVAQAHNHFASAMADYRKIIDENLYPYKGIYASVAECEFNMGQHQRALDDIDYAIAAIPDNASYHLLRSRTLRAMGRQDEAVQAAARALAIEPGSPEALKLMALCYMDQDNLKEAASLLGEACMNQSEDPELFLIRAAVLDKLNQPVAARGMREKVLEISTYSDLDPRSLKGFALDALGRSAEAQTWMDGILTANPDHDGMANYLGACFFTCRGDNDRALQCAEQSLRKGYANYYNWMLNTDLPVNPAPLRDDLRFLNLMERYRGLFNAD